jgi:hypothetical protein
LAGLLAEFEVELRRQGCPLVDRLAPGLSPAALDAPTNRGLPLPEEARVWWSWHDGAPGTYTEPPDFSLGGFWVLLSLSEAHKEYHEHRSVAEHVSKPPGYGDVEDWWPWSWMPITRASNGDAITVDLAVPEGAPSTTRLYRLGDVELVAAAQPSLAALVEVWSWRCAPVPGATSPGGAGIVNRSTCRHRSTTSVSCERRFDGVGGPAW